MTLRQKSCFPVGIQMSMRRALCAKCGSSAVHENNVVSQFHGQMKRPKRLALKDEAFTEANRSGNPVRQPPMRRPKQHV